MAFSLSTSARTQISKRIIRYEQLEAAAALNPNNYCLHDRPGVYIFSGREHPDLNGRVSTSNAHHHYRVSVLVTGRMEDLLDC